MAKIKIYGLNTPLSKYAGQLSIVIDDAVMETLSFPLENKCYRFVRLKRSKSIHPDDWNEKYTLIEISMSEGRTVDTKKK
jgi:hypothetical protein